MYLKFVSTSAVLALAAGLAVVAVLLTTGAAALAANLSPWSAASGVNGGNTSTFVDGCPSITKSGDALYFASNRPGGSGGLDLYVSRWDPIVSRWGEPSNLGNGVNTAANEQCPLVLNSGKELVFVSDRPGGAGGLDLWVSVREDHRDDGGWHSPVNIATVNSSAADFGPGAYEAEDGTVALYFNSNRAGGAGGHDLYLTMNVAPGTFSAPVPLSELNTSSEEQFPALRKDGLEMFFASNRPGGSGNLDLWHATRPSTSSVWNAPVNLGPAVNSPAVEGRSAISWDGKSLIFHSNRAGTVDLYEVTRTQLTGKPE